MRCIYCSQKATSVADTREHKLGVRRRRHCRSCGARFTTTEAALAENLFVLKRNGHRQRFSRDKLFVSIFQALYGGKNPDSGDVAKDSAVITREVCDQILNKQQRTVQSKEIAQLVYGTLLATSQFTADKYRLYSQYRKQSIEE